MDALLVSILCGLLPINTIVELCNLGTLFAFSIVSISVAILRKTQPELKRPFRCPAVYLVVPLAVLFCGYLITNLPKETFIFFGIWYAVGMVVYFSYSRYHTNYTQ